jgi:membrane protease YdiL (CAAX protease family)
MRSKPSILKGLLILIGYLAVVFTVWIATDMKYDEVGDTVENVRKAVVLAVGLGAVYLIIVTSVLGWWRPALREPRRVGGGWMWLVPILLALGAVGNLASTKWGEIDGLGTYVFWLAIGCAFVGFSEELVTRGLLIVGARGSLHEPMVWFVSSLCFGLLHVPNVFFGQGGRETAQQVVFAFVVGTTYYVTRRISGALVVTMVLHAAWDFSTFIQEHSVDGLADKPIAAGGFVLWPAMILGLVALVMILKRGDVVEPGGDQDAEFDRPALVEV